MSTSGGIANLQGNIVGTPSAVDARAQADGQSAGLIGLATWTIVGGMISGSLADRLRTPNVFKSVAANASGDTAIWTPGAGKKFRLMGFLITLSNGAAQAAGAALTMQFRDGVTAMGITIAPYVPAAAGTLVGATVWSVPSLGNGVLSAAANNVLNFNLAAALTASFAQIDVWGTEE